MRLPTRNRTLRNSRTSSGGGAGGWSERGEDKRVEGEEEEEAGVEWEREALMVA